jgi:hypothetical protein
VLASPLIYSGQLSREDYELRLAHSSGTRKLKHTERCSSSSPSIQTSTFLTSQTRTFAMLAGRIATIRLVVGVRQIMCRMPAGGPIASEIYAGGLITCWVPVGGPTMCGILRANHVKDVDQRTNHI